jgi:sec-independent protein translocase protein TatA
MPNLGPGEILLVVGVIVLLFGAKRLPEIARSMGKAKTEFKKGLQEGEAESKREAGAEEVKKAEEVKTADTTS